MAPSDPFSSFSHLLDSRIIRSLATLFFTHPTSVQAAVLPLALDGQDILARARTGSGKTLAYGIPLFQSILKAKAALSGGLTDPDLHATRALILVPTRELAEQVTSHLKSLAQGLGDESLIQVCNVAGSSPTGSGKGVGGSDKVHRMQLAERPDIVVATPSRALNHLRSKHMTLSKVQSIVIDEADLILAYGHSSDDIMAITSGPWDLPVVYQSFLMSATMSSEVEELKGVVLRNPAVLMVEEDQSELDNLTQYCVKCAEDDKFLLLYVICKLKLIKGKCLIFVNDTDRSYRLKLFLEKFGIKAGVLNAELPFNSRYHAVQEFNRGVFPYLIATDESGLEGVERDSDYEAEPISTLISTQPATEPPEPSAPKSRKRKRKSGHHGPSEYGVARGIDFVDVACVINFDLPTSSRSYTHRVGRTARAGRAGMALSFVVPKALWGKKKLAEGVGSPSARSDESVWKRIDRQQGKKGAEVKDYRFDMAQVEGFRYRMEDGLRSVTKATVREARIKELKNEALNSEKLKTHFEDNPRDLSYLRHDKPLHPTRVQPHLKYVPAYLMPHIAAVGPPGGSSLEVEAEPSDVGPVKFHKEKNRSRGKPHRGSHKQKHGGRKADPLRTFKSKPKPRS